MGKKLEDVRIVTFKEDYNPSGKMVIYKEGETHPIHKSTVELLGIGKKIKADVKEFDEKKETEKAKAEFDKAKKEEAKS